MIKILISLLTIILFLTSFSTAQEYSVDRINTELLKGANAVIRKKHIHFEVKDEKSAVLKETVAVTIFTKDEQQYGKKVLWYDKFRDIEQIKGKLFDSQGKLIRELSNKEINDYSAFSDYSLYADTRIKYAELYYDKLPYTIEFFSEIYYDGYINWPTWYSRSNIDPVEHTKFEVVIPKKLLLRYWSNQESVNPTVKSDMYNNYYVWEKFDQLPLTRDAIGEDIEDVATIVMIAPEQFQIEGYKGNMSSWNEFGKWMQRLYNERQVTPEPLLEIVPSLISSATTQREKVAILYKYLQSRTRYVSVQLGIGGWQPFDAAYVHDRGYGDCKALTNYMISLLRIAGITAYPVLINNGSDRHPLIEQFPSNQFNHVVACVPLETDTIWLECTSQTLAFGRISWSNENRGALMITPEGGVVVRTPTSTHLDNTVCKKINAKIAGRNLEGDAFISWNGNKMDNVRPIAIQSSPKEQSQWISSMAGQQGFHVHSYSFDDLENVSGNMNLNFKFTLSTYVTSTGNRIFINPNLIEKVTSVPPEVPERLSPVRYKFPSSTIDTITFSIPADYKIESLPKELSLSASFGNFKSKVIPKDDFTIEYVRQLDIKDYLIPAEKYTEYRNFFMEVAKNDRSQIVLIKK